MERATIKENAKEYLIKAIAQELATAEVLMNI